MIANGVFYWLRALLLSFLAFDMGLMLYLFVGYALREFSPEDPPPLRRGMLLIASSYLLFMLYAGLDGFDRLRSGAPFTYRTVIAALAISTGLVGLVGVARVIAYVFGGHRK